MARQTLIASIIFVAYILLFVTIRPYKILLIKNEIFFLCFFPGLSYAFHHQRIKDGYNTLDDETTVLPFNPSMHSKLYEPHFDHSVPNNVTALVGKSAYLSCKVRNLGNKTVSLFYLFFIDIRRHI